MEGDETALKDEADSSSNSTPHEHRSFTEFAKDKLDSAGRELRRRLPMAGQLGAHLIHPRRLLLQNAQTQQIDVVLTFPKGLPDSMLLWLLQKLRGTRPRLHVCVRQHGSTQCSAFYITADDDVLLQIAEEIHLPKLLKPEFGGGYKEFTVRDMHCFQLGTSTASLFSSSERSYLVKHALETARAEPGDEHALEPPCTLKPHQSIVPACVSRGVVSAMYPLHDRKALDALRVKWLKSFHAPQPLDEICDYFGVQIAMYFAWLGHYTSCLTVPAVVGFIFWIWLGTANQYWKDIAHVLFSLFNVLWACVYLETWKRYSNVLAYRWGTLDQRDDLLVEPRPEFRGEMTISPVTGRSEAHYPNWRRLLFRVCISYPATAVCLALALYATRAILFAQEWWDARIVYLAWLPRAFLAILIAIEEETYARFARWLNDKAYVVPNHHHLFYIAFYLHDMDKLKEQLAVLLITRQIIGNLKESALPYVIENFRLAKMCVDVFGALSPSKTPTSEELTEMFNKKSDSSNPDDNVVTSDVSVNGDRKMSEPSVTRNVIHQAEMESQLFKYDGTFSEYLEMLTQLGHVTLFSCAFPLSAACALVNNALEIRADALKLCAVARRPFALRVTGVGGWQHAMEAMLLVAVIVNCCLIGLSGPLHRLMPDLEPTHAVILIVALEHLILIMVLIVRLAIPEIPSWLATEMAKVEFERREAIKNMHTVLSENPSQDDLTKSRGPSRIITPTTPKQAKLELKPELLVETIQPDKKKINSSMFKISDIPPFRPKATSITEPPVTKATGSLQALPDVSPTKPGRHHKESIPGAPLSLLGVRGLRDEPLHRSAHCIPHTSQHKAMANPQLQDLAGSVSAGTSEPDLNASSASVDAGSTAGDLDKTKDKDKAGSRSRAKALLVKRVRSVAVFSLGLRKAREAAQDKPAKTPDKPTTPHPPQSYGGELSLIPIEQLIQMEDVKRPGQS